MKFTSDFIEKVQEANNLVDIVSQYTVLKPAAGGFMGRCPFPDHPEKTPSFSVSEVKQVYNCFGCSKKGNIFSFLQAFNGMAFPEAVEYLAERARIPMPENPDAIADDGVRDKKKAIFELNRITQQYFKQQLLKCVESSDVKKYLAKRKLSAGIVEEFQLGLSTQEWDGLVSEFGRKKQIGKFEIFKLAEEAKLIKQRKQDQGYFDIFRDRLMFPIILPNGEVAGFGGRIILQGEPKYLNSPETLVFSKGKILYGLFHTAKYIRTEDQAIIVEGYMDLISLYQEGIKNVVASMGTALTLDQASALSKMTKNVLALFDGDFAGQEAAERSLPILLQAGLYPKGLILPDKMDPDDYVQKFGAEQFQTELKNAQDLFLIVLEKWTRDLANSPSDKVKICDLAKPILEKVQDHRLKDLYIGEISQRLGVSVLWVKDAVGAAERRNRAPLPTQELTSESVGDFAEIVNSPAKLSLKKAPHAELELLRMVLKSRANFELWRIEGSLEDILHPIVKRVLIRAIDDYGQSPEKFDKLPSLLINFIDHPDLFVSQEIDERKSSVEIERQTEADFQFVKDAIKKVKENYLRHELKAVKMELINNPNSQSLERLKELQKKLITGV